MNWREWLADQRAKSTMKTTRIPLQDAEPWAMQEDGKFFGRPDAKFFTLVGVQVECDGHTWRQALIQETDKGHGILVLARRLSMGNSRRFRPTYKYLVQAKPEVGNPTNGKILICPTLQASRDNFDGHGVVDVLHRDLYDLVEKKGIRWTTIVQHGGRYREKVNDHAIVDVPFDYEPANDSFHWMTLRELCEALHEGELNNCMRDLLAMELALGL